MKVVVYTLGCKVNAVESRSIMHELSLRGVEAVEKLEKADVYVFNTCSVTSEADRKCRQAIGKFYKLNPDAKVYVVGCSSQRDAAMYTEHANVVYISGTGEKAAVIDAIMSDMVIENKVNMRELPSVFEELTFPRHIKTRDFIKIQDGCNNFCSYCIIPHIRGSERSRAIASIVEEAELAAENCKEIVFTGINVSAYGKDIGSSLSDLVFALKDIPVRKRLSSLECTVIDRKLLEAVKVSGFCDHFHLSLQSGCDSVLKSMNRHYTADEYFTKVELIREYFPDAGITTDIITGFPEESDSDFEATMVFVRRVGFLDLHVFPYSERAGTKAAEMKQIPPNIRRKRANELIALGGELKKEFCEKMIGKTMPVYVESDGRGYTTNYIKVRTDEKEGAIANVKICMDNIIL